MSLYQQLQQRAAAGRPIRVGLIGAGKFGSMYLAQVPRMGKGRLKRLAAVDTDTDGKLSFKEVVESRMAYFDAADTDQDDQLSLPECVAYERQRRGSKP